MLTTTVSEARAALPELLNRVEDGEEVTITRHGKPVAVVVRPDALRTRRATKALSGAEQIGELMTQAWETALPQEGVQPDRAEALISEIRAHRDAR